MHSNEAPLIIVSVWDSMSVWDAILSRIFSETNCTPSGKKTDLNAGSNHIVGAKDWMQVDSLQVFYHKQTIKQIH